MPHDGVQTEQTLKLPMHDLIERAPTPHSVTNRRLDITKKKHRKSVSSSRPILERQRSRLRVDDTDGLIARPSAPLSIVFVGVAVRERPDLDDKGAEYAIAVSDGCGIVQVRAWHVMCS